MKVIGLILLIAAGWVGGYGYGRWYRKPAAAAGEKKIVFYVDPMHPWYKSDKPGIAPDCNMDLVPVYAGDEGKYQAKKESAPGEIEIPVEKQQLLGITYGTVAYKDAADSIRAAARVTLDETKVSKIQAKLDGWIEQVFVDFTGKQVQQGDPLLTIYSPEALATQQEFLLALKASRTMRDNPVHEMMGSTGNLLAASRKRLELWDISNQEIDRIESSGQTLKYLTLTSPISGFVMERNAFPKQRLTPETLLYTLADLSNVWVIADVYEYEASRVRLGQSATLTLSYQPGRVYRGKVSYILPQVDPATRTLKVRLEFANPGFALKPDLYGEVELKTGGGKRLMVPSSAVLNSGDRQTVFVDRGSGSFEPRPVTIGSQFGDRTEILSGLKAGERIVTSGNFLLDSESRLR
jgi:membrane fusion protein, copper/silver efflux system